MNIIHHSTRRRIDHLLTDLTEVLNRLEKLAAELAKVDR
jgi:hypothetical protein